MPFWKRLFDIAIGIVAMPLLGICTLFMMALHSLFSPGPVLFRQERVGLNGSKFQCFKFRTMVVGADCSVHQAYVVDLMGSRAPMVKLDSKRDSRLIVGGWLIRATGLDELPQLINVLRGEMSFVGPRPCLPNEYDHYLPWQKRRFEATPGLTGLWQVSGKNRTTFDEMIRLDVLYAQTVSPWLDARIIVMTVPAIVVQISDTRRMRRVAREEKDALAIAQAPHAVSKLKRVG
jgi:lipopolysaccharide/colanic/teichoic acid biosynthesis glycosyltransferase